MNNFVKFKSGKRIFTNKKEEVEKNLLLLENLKILNFYWNLNLTPLWFQLSKMFWKIFFGSKVMSNGIEIIIVLPFFALFLSKMLVITVHPRRIFENSFSSWNCERSRFSLQIKKNCKIFTFLKKSWFFSSFSSSFLNLLFSDLNYT